jgi:hypothetical protein
MSERHRHAFLNQRSGTFTPTSEEWVLRADQWSQTYYQFRDGKLYFVENDNKEQQHSESEQDIAAFILQYAATPTSPYPELMAFLAGLGHGRDVALGESAEGASPGCPECRRYFGDWRSHGPEFPHDAWVIVESEEHEVGTHGSVTVMSGVARCRACQSEATFGCTYGPGYHFEAGR